MNFQICLAFIYFNAGIYAWRPFYRAFEQKTRRNVAKTTITIEETNRNNHLNNLTNHTFMDDEEFMKVLRFYRPI